MFGLRKRLIKLSCVAMFCAAPLGAFAQTTAPGAAVETEEIDTVFVFNRVCYARVPNVQAIRDMATELAWLDLDKNELEEFDTGGRLDVLEGWDARIGERVYRVAVSQGPVTEAQLKIFPDFVDGLTTSCTLILDGLDQPGVVAGDMQVLAGKEPVSADVAEGSLKTTTWAGGNDQVKVFLIYRSGDESGGLINVTVLTK